MIALRSPMHALFWKEWRGLRHLRWACIGLGALLPLFFIAGTAMGRSGFSPFGRVSALSTGTILHDVVPGTFAFALWPFAALVLIAQALAGDRAAGTEAFLLERPVTRRRVWTLRLAASSLSAATVVACTAAVWVVWVLAGGGVGPQGWKGPLSMFAYGGAILLGIAPCAALASSLIASPFLALLTSALLAGVPLLLCVGLAGLFPYAGWGQEPIGGLVPWLLIPIYLVVSYIAASTGEPAGRGRAARGLGGLGLGVLVTLFVFVTSAQAFLRREAVRPEISGVIVSATQGDRAIVGGYWGGLWLLNTKTGAILGHYPRPSREAVWNADGSMFAIQTCAGPLGSNGRCRVSLFDREGKPSAIPWLASPDEDAFRLAWGKERLFFRTGSEQNGGALVSFDPVRGAAQRMAMPRSLAAWDFAGMLWDGTPALVKILPGETLYDPKNPGAAPVKESAFGLYRFDPETGAVEPEPLVIDHGSPWSVRAGGLSPNGRWYQLHTPSSLPKEIIDLQTGNRVPATQGGWPEDSIRWYLQSEGDATSLIEARQGTPARPLRSWPHVWADLRPSSDRRYLLIRLWLGKEAATTGSVPSYDEWLYDSLPGSWVRLPMPPKAQEREGSGSAYDDWRTWAGPRTLVLWGPDWLAFEDVDGLGRFRYVAGGP